MQNTIMFTISKTVGTFLFGVFNLFGNPRHLFFFLLVLSVALTILNYIKCEGTKWQIKNGFLRFITMSGVSLAQGNILFFSNEYLITVHGISLWDQFVQTVESFIKSPPFGGIMVFLLIAAVILSPVYNLLMPFLTIFCAPFDKMFPASAPAGKPDDFEDEE